MYYRRACFYTAEKLIFGAPLSFFQSPHLWKEIQLPRWFMGAQLMFVSTYVFVWFIIIIIHTQDVNSKEAVCTYNSQLRILEKIKFKSKAYLTDIFYKNLLEE